MITVSAEASKEIPSIGDQLADNLIAQSLDLPPKAAKVRYSAKLMKMLLLATVLGRANSRDL